MTTVIIISIMTTVITLFVLTSPHGRGHQNDKQNQDRNKHQHKQSPRHVKLFSYPISLFNKKD